MNEESTEAQVPDTLEERQKHLLMLHGDILTQLSSFDRFMTFITINYAIGVNPETNRFEVKELPPAVVLEKMENLRSVHDSVTGPAVHMPSQADTKKFGK